MDDFISHVFNWSGVLLAGIIVFVLLPKTVFVLKQYERGIVLTWGIFSGVRSPGINFLIPFIQKISVVDVRTIAMSLAPQDVITKDNVSATVSATAYFKIVDPELAVLAIQDRDGAINKLASTVLRSVIGMHPLDELLSQQDKLNIAILETIKVRTGEWGLTVSHIEIKSVDLKDSMIRAMAQEAEAERGARARKITAQGELEASKALAEAAEMLSSPAAMALRTLATIKEVGCDFHGLALAA